MVSLQTVIGAAAMVARLGSIPLREQSPGRPPFWAKPLLATKTRPIPANTDWFTYLFLKCGVDFFPEGYAGVVNRFIASGKEDPATSGLEYRFLLDGDLVSDEEFEIPAGFDLNVDHAATIPFPAQARRCFFNISVNHSLSLQVRNTSVSSSIAYAGLFGWYYSALGSQERDAFEATGFKQEDSVRNPAGGGDG
jgi:hypothetical protein